MANQRTFMASLRTALSLVVAGAAVIKFFPHPVAQVVGWLLFPAGAAVMLWGALSYRKTRRLILEEEKAARAREQEGD